MSDGTVLWTYHWGMPAWISTIRFFGWPLTERTTSTAKKYVMRDCRVNSPHGGVGICLYVAKALMRRYEARRRGVRWISSPKEDPTVEIVVATPQTSGVTAPAEEDRNAGTVV